MDRSHRSRRLLARAERKAVILPLYLYDHSGLAMNTVGFHCPWDSGQVGWIHVDLAAIREEHGCKRVSAALRRAVEDQLRQEVSTYADYLAGNCFGYVVEKDGEQVDSCLGFIGDYEGYCLEAARLAVPGCVAVGPVSRVKDKVLRGEPVRFERAP